MTAVARKQRSKAAVQDAATPLLAWYDRDRRHLPWRYPPGSTADPYRVWLSEVMLQQTTVKVVIGYFERFVARWPTVVDLAAASEDTVLEEWAGLGYYSRARNLHAGARAIVERHAGVFPRTEAELLELPGIGPYTAAAIAAIAFGQLASPVDGNIERVVSRLFAVQTPMPTAKAELRMLAATLTPVSRPGDFAQAMMDLGATICTPRRPSCLMCPIQSLCRANSASIADSLPVRAPKAVRPTRYGMAFIGLREDGRLLLRRRPDEGLLARMMEVPSTPWVGEEPDIPSSLQSAPIRADWWQVPGSVVHTFTHFKLELIVMRAVVPADCALTFWAEQERCQWVARPDLKRTALPSVMRKIIAHALKEN